jgi:leucyl aminopeptidase
VRQAAAEAVQRARQMQIASLSVGVNGELPLDAAMAGQSLAEGVELGAYRYWHYRTGLSTAENFEVEKVTILTAKGRLEKVKSGVATGRIVAGGVRLARDIVNSPGFAMTPPRLGELALEMGERLPLDVMVLDQAALTQQGFGGILAVGKGSDHEPRFIAMEYGKAGRDRPTICLVGKGLTFDSGGLSLKPADAMETMKNDKGGAAAVFGAVQVAAQLKLPLHVVGLVSSAENMPSGDAYRPGDIVTTLSGKTIEVLNTDAEGRVILSDALYYAQRYKPDAIINLATLTGAMIIALGNQVTGMMGTDQALMDRIAAAGEATGERVWQLPLWDNYVQMVKSDVADLKNMAGRPAGSITAAAFLKAFAGDYPFAHLDIAGTAWTERPSKPFESTGATGVGVRLLTEFLRTYDEPVSLQRAA